MTKKIPAFLLCLLSLISCASDSKSGTGVPEADDPRIKTENYLMEAIEDFNIKGMSVAISDSRGALFLKGYGSAREGVAFTADTISCIKSVSKPFTALAIMKLVEDGVMDLDRPVSAYLPEFAPKTWGPDPDNVTIRSLLTHSSGLQSDYSKDWYFEKTFMEIEGSDSSNLLNQINNTTLCTEVNTISAYSNLGFTLLSLVIERVTGRDFNDYMVNEVLKPLGMEKSSYLFNSQYEHLYPLGYESGVWKDRSVYRGLASGALSSSAREMSTFMTYMLANSNRDYINELWSLQNGNVPLDFDKEQMLTWFVVESDSDPERKYIGHGGDGYPFHAFTLFDPALDLGVTIMVNGMEGISYDLLDLCREIMKFYTLSREGIELKPNPWVFNSPRKSITPEIKERIVGHWVGGGGVTSISESNNRLKINLLEKDFDLYYHGENRFSIGYKALGLFPVNPLNINSYSLKLEEHGGKYFIQFLQEGNQLEVLEKIEPVRLHKSWNGRMGTWESTGSSPTDGVSIAEINLVVDESTGLHCLEYQLDGYEVKTPVASRDETHLYTRGYGRNLGETISLEVKDGIEHLEYSGLSFIKKEN